MTADHITSSVDRSPKQSSFRVAIIGGGITGACAASVLRSAAVDSILARKGNQDCNNIDIAPVTRHITNGDTSSCWDGIDIEIDLFDQGRSGVGGRSSHRQKEDEKNGPLRWDHGCQFFRADTPVFKKVVKNWIENKVAEEWKGRFVASPSHATTVADTTTPSSPDLDFFGLPSLPPFYVGTDGMRTIPAQILVSDGINASKGNDKDGPNDILKLFQGTRVARMERNETTRKWFLFGTSGEGAYHDTSEKIAKETKEVTLGRQLSCGYDAVILTDVSSSFGKWHRASAGVPEDFAARVRKRVGARVPLFATMVAFDKEIVVPFDAISFRENKALWFAARTNSKPLSVPNVEKDCWTLISTPEYAMEKITETPMQDPATGEFVPQSNDYLVTVPGADLEKAFRKELESTSQNCNIPDTVYIDSQRWGSALPCHRHLNDKSSTRRIISGVAYDSHRSALAPTKVEVSVTNQEEEAEIRNFLLDENLMLYQAGDMMSTYTPGYEGAAISGIEAAEHLIDSILSHKK